MALAAAVLDAPARPILDELEADWGLWLVALFRGYFTDRLGVHLLPFGAHHAAFWEWVWSMRRGQRPPPFIGIWPRGGGKSTNAEMACVALGARGVRRYGLYVSETQDQADDHISNVAALLESQAVEAFYPDLATRLVGKYGSSKGWRRNRLRTQAWFTVDAIGLDTAARGIKLESDRPDFLVFDDLDSELDTERATARKIKILTKRLLPAGASDLAVLGMQNLVQPDGIFAQLVDGRADFLAERQVSGPHPAIAGLTYETRGDKLVLTGGEPLWAGQSLEHCQELVDDIGLAAFLTECQHAVDAPAGALWQRDELHTHRVTGHPDLARVVVGVDPSGSTTGDEQGIVVAGRGIDGHGYVLADASCSLPPEGWATRAVEAYHRHQADSIVAEKNYGGDMVLATIRTVDKTVPVKLVTASRGKVVRAEPVASLYTQGRVHHVGVQQQLERQMTGWDPADYDGSPDRVDALVWALTDLFPPTGQPNARLVGDADGRAGTDRAWHSLGSW
jgi:hypothetical protein